METSLSSDTLVLGTQHIRCHTNAFSLPLPLNLKINNYPLVRLLKKPEYRAITEIYLCPRCNPQDINCTYRNLAGCVYKERGLPLCAKICIEPL
jgi:hypothetical protein